MGWRIVAVLAVIMGLSAASAGAATYCVPGPSCSAGTAQPTLADAVDAANATVEADDIFLAPGTFAGGVTVGSHPVRIHGSGIGTTRIEGGDGLYGVQMDQPDSSLDDLTIHEPSGGPAIGLYLSGSAHRVVVDQRDNAAAADAGVSLHGEGSFEDGSALAPLDSTRAYSGIDAWSSGPMLVSRVTVQGRYGMTTNGPGPVTVRFARITGVDYGINAAAASTLIDDSIVSGGPVAGDSFGGSGDIITTLRHVTLNGGYVAARSDNFDSTVVVSNSAVVGGGPDPETPDLQLQRSGSGTARLEADYSFFRASHVAFAPGAGIEYVPGSHNIDGADAKFLDLAGGDLRLTAASPLIDAGDPVPGGGEPQADLAGEFRAVNGRTDIGAYEYGRHAPGVSAAAETPTALAGATVKFSAGTSDADPGELPAVTWSFDDGGTAAGPAVSHAFTMPGVHTATATATDPAGLKAAATAIVTVTISAPPPGLVRKAAAAAFQFRKLSARRNIVRVALSCPILASRCTGRIELRLAHRRTVLGKARYSIAHGTIRTVKVKLNKGARKRLRRARHGLRVKVVVKPKGARTASRTVTLRRSRKTH
jgi:hypothetical protein